jgi:hypothetical protein
VRVEIRFRFRRNRLRRFKSDLARNAMISASLVISTAGDAGASSASFWWPAVVDSLKALDPCGRFEKRT